MRRSSEHEIRALLWMLLALQCEGWVMAMVVCGAAGTWHLVRSIIFLQSEPK